MDRDCNKCVWSTRDGNCRKWFCEGTKTVKDIRAEVIAECINELKEEHECWINRGKNDYAFGVRLCIEDLEKLKG